MPISERELNGGRATVQRSCAHMIPRLRIALVAIAVICMVVSVARADPAECREAVDRYNEATSEVADALRAYSRCVSDRRGHDDCSSEFSREPERAIIGADQLWCCYLTAPRT
jgi:hypothetical protein